MQTFSIISEKGKVVLDCSASFEIAAHHEAWRYPSIQTHWKQLDIDLFYSLGLFCQTINGQGWIWKAESRPLIRDVYQYIFLTIVQYVYNMSAMLNTRG